MSEETLIKALMHRRVPQILGLYLGGAWVAIEFSNMIAQRFALSQTLVDFLLVLLASFVPTVLMLAWFHGAPGRDQWTPIEKIGIPVNVLVSIALLASLFQGEELGATTTTVTVINEDGQQVEQVLAKPELRQRIAVFFFDNDSGDPELDWLQYGLNLAIAADLGQSMFVNVWTPYREYESRGFVEFRKAGFADGINVPVALLKAIAQKKRRDLFITGEFGKLDEQYTLQLDVYRTADSKLIISEQASGEDLLTLAERLSDTVQRKIDLPGSGASNELGIADRASESRDALRYAILGMNAENLDNDLPAAIGYWKQAVELDPSFAMVHMMMASAIFQLGDMEGAAESVRKALQHDYKLTDDNKFLAKGMNYALRNQNDKAIRLYEMWVELYPENTLARKYLAGAYTQIASRVDEAIEQLRIAYELDPADSGLLLWMAELHEVNGDIDLAIADYTRYSEQNPDDATPLVRKAGTLANAGQLTEARESFERAELLEPELISPPIGLADLAVREGRYQQAERYLSYADSISRIPQQEAQVVRGWIAYRYARGQIAAVLELIDRLYQVEQAFAQPINLLMLTYVQYAAAYAEAGETERGQKILSRLQADFEPPLDGLAEVGLMSLWIADGDQLRGLEHTDKVDEFLQLLQQERYTYVVEMSRAALARLDGDLEQAVRMQRSALQRFSQFSMSGEEELDQIRMILDLTAMLIEAEEPEEAMKSLEPLLRSYPAHPIANLLQARAEFALGNIARAKTALEKTLLAYADADPIYPPAIEARQLAQIL